MAKEEETTEEIEEVETKEETEEKSHTLSQEDINKLVNAAQEKARKQEKDKLYTTINSLKDQVSELSKDRKAEKEAKDKAEKEANEKLEVERQAKLSTEDKLAEQLKKFEARLENEEKERQDLRAQLAQEKADRELVEYRQGVIEAETEPFLKELVQGKTKEEIDHSVATAKAKYQEYFKAAVNLAEGQGGKDKPEMPRPGGGDTEETLDQVGGLVPQIDPNDVSNTRVSEDYVKNREELLRRVAGAYKRAASGR